MKSTPNVDAHPGREKILLEIMQEKDCFPKCTDLRISLIQIQKSSAALSYHLYEGYILIWIDNNKIPACIPPMNTEQNSSLGGSRVP